MIKRIITTFLILALAFTTLSASDFATSEMGRRERTPNNAELLGMGGAGVAITDSENAFFTNPAALAEKKFRLSIPSVSVTTYHVSELLKKDADGKTAIDKIKSSEDTAGMVTSILNVVGTQFAPLVRVDSAVSMVLPFGLGFGVYAGDTAYTYSGSVIDEMDVTAVLGFAHKFNIGSSAKLSFGVSGKFSALGVSERIKASDLSALSDDEKTMVVAVATGWAPLMDVGAIFSWHGLSFGIACTDILLTGGYKMDIENVAVKNIGTEYEKFMSLERDGDFVIKADPDLKAGVAYELDTSIIDLKVALDITDLITLFKDKDNLNGRRIMRNVSAGAEVGLLGTFVVRGGLNSGYWTAGASVDLWALRIDCAYFWQEMGSSAGQRGLDGLTIRFNLGWER